MQNPGFCSGVFFIWKNEALVRSQIPEERSPRRSSTRRGWPGGQPSDLARRGFCSGRTTSSSFIRTINPLNPINLIFRGVDEDVNLPDEECLRRFTNPGRTTSSSFHNIHFLLKRHKRKIRFRRLSVDGNKKWYELASEKWYTWKKWENKLFVFCSMLESPLGLHKNSNGCVNPSENAGKNISSPSALCPKAP